MQYNVYSMGQEMYFLHRARCCLTPQNIGKLMPFVLAGHEVPAQLSINLARNHLQAISVHLFQPFSGALLAKLPFLLGRELIFRSARLGN
jgi:hypothetical protein